MKKHKQVFGCVFIIFLLLNLLVINVIQAQKTSTITDTNNQRIINKFKEILNIPWENISNFLQQLLTFSLKAAYGGMFIAFFGQILQILGFEIIGYRLFTFGMRFFVACFSVCTISFVLMMFIDRFVLSEYINFQELNQQNMLMNNHQISYQGGS